MSRVESVDFDLLHSETCVYGGFNGRQRTLTAVANGYTIGYTNLGRKGIAVTYVASLRRTDADNGVRTTKPKTEQGSCYERNS